MEEAPKCPKCVVEMMRECLRDEDSHGNIHGDCYWRCPECEETWDDDELNGKPVGDY